MLLKSPFPFRQMTQSRAALLWAGLGRRGEIPVVTSLCFPEAALPASQHYPGVAMNKPTGCAANTNSLEPPFPGCQGTTVWGKRKGRRSELMGSMETSTCVLRGNPVLPCLGSLGLPSWCTSRIHAGLLPSTHNHCTEHLFLEVSGATVLASVLQFCSRIH